MPHATPPSEFTPSLYPPFPSSSSFPTLSLPSISLSKLQQHDAAEQERVFAACTTRGFFYLDLADTAQGAALLRGGEEICGVAERAFRLPLEEKMRFALGRGKTLFGYKKVGTTVTDAKRTPDTAEFFNVGKNDMLLLAGDGDGAGERAAQQQQQQQNYPDVILERKQLFREYSETAHAVGLQILDILARKLGIAGGEMRDRHALGEMAGDHVRMTRGPPRKDIAMPEIQTPSHTDFGTITLLQNWLGGLQLHCEPNRVVGNLSYDDGNTPSLSSSRSSPDQWLYLPPKPRHMIVNLGDAAVKFSRGALCSGRHRVVPAPGEQGLWPRYSVVYFVRPVDGCVMRGLTAPKDGEDEGEEEEISAKEWIFRQSERLRGGGGD